MENKPRHWEELVGGALRAELLEKSTPSSWLLTLVEHHTNFFHEFVNREECAGKPPPKWARVYEEPLANPRYYAT